MTAPVGNASGDEPEGTASAYGVNQQRLAELKRRYDPTNLFRMNPNIGPEGEGATRSAERT